MLRRVVAPCVCRLRGVHPGMLEASRFGGRSSPRSDRTAFDGGSTNSLRPEAFDYELSNDVRDRHLGVTVDRDLSRLPGAYEPGGRRFESCRARHL